MHLGTLPSRHRPPVAAVLITAALLVGGAGLAGCAGPTTEPAADAAGQPVATQPVVRTRLGQTQPANAPGQTLYLEEVRIEPGAQLATHFHEGTQVARVVSGTLTYNVISGPVTVVRSNGEEVVTGPVVLTIGPGEGVVETEQVVHFGANSGEEPVVILLSALLADGAPMATAVDEPPAD